MALGLQGKVKFIPPNEGRAKGLVLLRSQTYTPNP